jgi:hypothetical protein
MLSDTLADAVVEIEEYEKDYPESYAGLAEEIRKVKLEMMQLQSRLDLLPPIADTVTDADREWIWAEALKRGPKRPPFEFGAVVDECWRDFWEKWKKRKHRNAAVRDYVKKLERAKK